MTVAAFALVVLLAVAAEAGRPLRRGREAEFISHIENEEVVDVAIEVEGDDTEDTAASAEGDVYTAEEVASETDGEVLAEEEEYTIMGIAELTNALNEDFAEAPLFVYVLIGVVVAIGVGIPALAVMRWRASRRSLSEKESLSLIRHAQHQGSHGTLSNPNSPKYIPPWSPRHVASPYSTTPSTPAGSNTSGQISMRIRTPNRVESPPSPNRQYLSTMKVGATPPSPGRDINV